MARYFRCGTSSSLRRSGCRIPHLASHRPGCRQSVRRAVPGGLAPLRANWVRAWSLRATRRRVVFPVLNAAGELVEIHGRAINPDEYGPKVITGGDLGAGVFCTSLQALEAETLVIVEAPIDALRLASAGCQHCRLWDVDSPVASAIGRISRLSDALAKLHIAEFRFVRCQTRLGEHRRRHIHAAKAPGWPNHPHGGQVSMPAPEPTKPPSPRLTASWRQSTPSKLLLRTRPRPCYGK
jgi:hypothetical protein